MDLFKPCLNPYESKMDKIALFQGSSLWCLRGEDLILEELEQSILKTEIIFSLPVQPVALIVLFISTHTYLCSKFI